MRSLSCFLGLCQHGFARKEFGLRQRRRYDCKESHGGLLQVLSRTDAGASVDHSRAHRKSKSTTSPQFSRSAGQFHFRTPIIRTRALASSILGLFIPLYTLLVFVLANVHICSTAVAQVANRHLVACPTSASGRDSRLARATACRHDFRGCAHDAPRTRSRFWCISSQRPERIHFELPRRRFGDKSHEDSEVVFR